MGGYARDVSGPALVVVNHSGCPAFVACAMCAFCCLCIRRLLTAAAKNDLGYGATPSIIRERSLFYQTSYTREICGPQVV